MLKTFQTPKEQRKTQEFPIVGYGLVKRSMLCSDYEDKHK